MTDSQPNALSAARSAYLRSAMHQPVQWREWGPAAFSEARRQEKPILLDIGAVWCHWCHVMDRESYEDAETARLINEHFLPIKVDRDERPGVDARYQSAVSAIAGQGGWPLTVFLTPEGKPFFGGTYFPPLDGHGRPGLRRVLMTMAESFQKRRADVEETALSVMAAIEHNETFDGTRPNPGLELVEKLVLSALQQFDPRHGGFGAQPKFAHSPAIDLLLDQAGRGSGEIPQRSRIAALTTLEKIAKGGIHDHLAGGFHRYSVDERWVVPHFEKMSCDNSELLKNFVHAFQATGEAECARIARETIRWIDAEMSDRALGGFYASQDADADLDDDGDYFTWTREEAAAVLTPEELTVAADFFDIGELGDMRHNPQKNTLHIDIPLTAVAARHGLDPAAAETLILSAKAKLHAARQLRPAPFIDRTLYVAWNAMTISAFLAAGRALPEPSATAFALKTLDRLLATAWNGASALAQLAHVIAYADGQQEGENIPGLLDDYVFTAHAALDAWQATGEFRYFAASLALAEAIVARFHDPERGGFFDTEPAGPETLGALTARRKPLQDAASTPAANPAAASLLLRLESLTARAEFVQIAKRTLESFAGVVEHFGLYAASYGLALRRLLLPPVQIVVAGTDALADELALTALRGYAVERSVIRLPSTAVELPPSLAATIPHLPPQPGSFAVVCSHFTCGQPMSSPQELAKLLLSSSTATA